MVLEAKARVAYPEGLAAARIERWALQSQARELLPKERISGCQRRRVTGAPFVGVKWSESRKRASYANLQSCGSVWLCPVCAAKISEGRRTELSLLVKRHQDAGGVVLLATRTFPHYANQSLQSLQSKLRTAEDKYKSGAPWQRVVAKFGIEHSVRSVEVTYGSNGWHPHIHELLFLKAGVDVDALQAALFVRWKSAAVRAGFDAPSEKHGVDVRDGSYAARYASKWGLESELTKWHVKKGKGVSLSPFDLLRIAMQDEGAAGTRAAALYQEYARAFKGKRQLVYSKGLRELYRVEAVEDEELVKGEEPDAVLLGNFSLGQWRAILRAGVRGKLLEVINENNGDWYAIDEVLGEALAYKGPPRHRSLL